MSHCIIIIDDVILVDQGFLCDEYARIVMAAIKIPPWWMLTGVGSYLQFEFMWRESLESEKIYHFTESNTNFTYPRQPRQ